MVHNMLTAEFPIWQRVVFKPSTNKTTTTKDKTKTKANVPLDDGQ